MDKLKIGQELWYVPNNYRRDMKPQGRTVKITKVGRKYAYLDDGRSRIFLDTHDQSYEVDGGDYTSPGACYLSENHYLDEKRLIDVVREFKKAVEVIAYYEVTVQQIRKAREILGI
jgi:hypothetical protein